MRLTQRTVSKIYDLDNSTIDKLEIALDRKMGNAFFSEVANAQTTLSDVYQYDDLSGNFLFPLVRHIAAVYDINRICRNLRLVDGYVEVKSSLREVHGIILNRCTITFSIMSSSGSLAALMDLMLNQSDIVLPPGHFELEDDRVMYNRLKEEKIRFESVLLACGINTIKSNAVAWTLSRLFVSGEYLVQNFDALLLSRSHVSSFRAAFRLLMLLCEQYANGNGFAYTYTGARIWKEAGNKLDTLTPPTPLISATASTAPPTR